MVVNKKEQNIKHYFSRGKLLLTGEYLVINGAMALGLPLKAGQSLSYFKSDGSLYLNWLSKEYGKIWFQASFAVNNFKILSSSDNKRAEFIRQILQAASKLSSNPIGGGIIETNTGFNINWGLGTSSSLISNIASLYEINPFDLHFSVSNGSGYDIACAISDGPVVYSLSNHSGIPVPQYRRVGFDPVFKDQIYFVYSGRKQNSYNSVSGFKTIKGAFLAESKMISEITLKVLNCTSSAKFISLLKEHDNLISEIVGKQPLYSNEFNEFDGYVKYLGAWGGDFYMVVTDLNYDKLKIELKQMGIEVVFMYNEIVY